MKKRYLAAAFILSLSAAFAAAPAANAEWEQTGEGYRWINEDGSARTERGWLTVGGKRYFIGKDGAVVSSTDINGKNVVAIAYNDEYTAVAVADGGTERAEIFIFDGSGKTVRSFEADGPKKLSFGGDSLYYLTLSGLYGVKIKTGETRGYPAANATDLVAADKTVFLFSRGSGTVLNKE